jgi:hypothetical protein
VRDHRITSQGLDQGLNAFLFFHCFVELSPIFGGSPLRTPAYTKARRRARQGANLPRTVPSEFLRFLRRFSVETKSNATRLTPIRRHADTPLPSLFWLRPEFSRTVAARFWFDGASEK